MTDEPAPDAGMYCRRVEEHLTRVNGGHLVRIVGPSFEMVRGWAEQGVPLSVVYRGIDLKAERHRLGRARRPLRIEHCESDVREVHDTWRRAVGAAAGPLPDAEPEPDIRARRPSLSKHLDRVSDRLAGLLGRMDLPDGLRDHVSAVLGDLSALRDRARATRGHGRDEILAALEPLERRLLDGARRALAADQLAVLTRDAQADLASYRDRLDAAAWQRAVDATVDRLLRERFGLPTMVMAPTT